MIKYIKKLLLLLFILCYAKSNAQKDSIVTFYDNKFNVVEKKSKAYFFEILTKVTDSLWLGRRYKKNGKIFHYVHYKSKNKKIKIGQALTINSNGKTVGLMYFNHKGEIHGMHKQWFDNGNLSLEGRYFNNKKEGLFKVYHFNSKIAGKAIFKNDTLTREIYYDIKGNVVNKEDVVCRQKAEFKGGEKAFKKKLRELKDKLTYKINGTVNVYFKINTLGDIVDVTLDGDLPLKLQKEVITFFESIKGWSPAIDRNRLVEASIVQKINFKL
ncbi:MULTISPECIES: hypothetical protein [Polaribacter]|uniref:TonB C-terminal domain-containing protein n=1 Tax=Polaribacter marinaquae TaxID=1642819 RepID=A0ABZ2TSQ5_9FLAO